MVLVACIGLRSIINLDAFIRARDARIVGARARRVWREKGENMTFAEQFKAKYDNSKKPQNLPIIEQKKPSLAECRSCSRFERGPDLPNGMGQISWCVTKGFDQIEKRPYTNYRNIELMESCQKTV